MMLREEQESTARIMDLVFKFCRNGELVLIKCTGFPAHARPVAAASAPSVNESMISITYASSLRFHALWK